MTTMREMVHLRVSRFEGSYERAKTKRFGFLVRPGILALGTVVLVVGLITIPLPGQGWLTTFLGVGILSLEARWAKTILSWGVGAYDSFFAWYHRQPRWLKWSLITVTVVVIFATFAVVTWAMWFFGTLDFLNPVFVDYLGWHRF